MEAIITGKGNHWHVQAGNRSHSGFASRHWAEVFCCSMGYVYNADDAEKEGDKTIE